MLTLKGEMRVKTGFTVALAGLLAAFGLAHAEPESPDSIVRVGACATPGITWGVFVRDNYAYVADRSRTTIVDVSDPSTPWVRSSLSVTPDSWGLGIFVEDTVAFPNHTGMGGGFATISVGNPDSPYVLGWCGAPPAPNPDPTGIWVIDTLAYLANGASGLNIINVAIPTSPSSIRLYDTPGYALDMCLVDTLTYIADYDSFLILNVADPMDPLRVGATDMPNSCYGISIAGSYAYVACESSFGNDGSLQVINVANPASPQIVANVSNINGDPLDVWVSGNYAFVAAADYWASHDGKERQVGGLRPERTADSKADVEGGLRVVDISNPEGPALVASYDTPGDPRGVFAVGDLAFVADYDSLQILRHIVVGIEEKLSQKLQVAGFRLHQNRPNPFSGATIISYELPVSSPVTLDIYDVTGQLVMTLVDDHEEAGNHIIGWDGRDKTSKAIANGVYFYRLATRSGTLYKKMLVIR